MGFRACTETNDMQFVTTKLHTVSSRETVWAISEHRNVAPDVGTISYSLHKNFLVRRFRIQPPRYNRGGSAAASRKGKEVLRKRIMM